MRTKITRWWPSHCGCSVSFSWDADVPEAEREHRFHTAHIKCEAHAHVPDGQAFLERLIAENRAHSLAQQEAPNG